MIATLLLRILLFSFFSLFFFSLGVVPRSFHHFLVACPSLREEKEHGFRDRFRRKERHSGDLATIEFSRV